MKSKLILDLSIYMIAPIMLFNIVDSKNLTYTVVVLMALSIIYSIFCKKRESRVNLSGIVFVSIFALMTFLRKDIESSYQVYVYDTYFLILVGISVLICSVLERDIIRRFYIDIQRAKGINKLSIWSNIKKSNISREFKQLSYLISIHLIIISLIMVYSISTNGKELYTMTENLEISISTAFLLGEIYMISKIMSKSKQIKNSKKKRSKSKYNLNNSRVVSFEKYKNANK